ncbi:MAG: CPBP family intramembrane metalloprotease [Bacteroidales bacterium]|nr:CPBP family intramembrane metalloprotease [Bacteroidales bacterium]
MLKASLSTLSDAKKLLMLIFIAIFSALIFSLVATIIVFAIYGAESFDWMTTMSVAPKSLAVLKVMQIMQTIGMFVVPGFLLAYMYSAQPFRYLGFKLFNLKSLVLVIVATIIALPGVNFLASLNEQLPLAQWMVDMEQKAEVLTKAFLTTDSFVVLLVNLFMIALLPALGEELIFRAIIQKHLSRITKSQVWGIVISALLFSAFHLQFQGFLPRFALGAMFGLMYAWSGSIWLPIAAHFTNNGIATVGYMMMGTGVIDNTVEEVGGLAYLWPVGLASLALVLFLLTRLRYENIQLPSKD